MPAHTRIMRILAFALLAQKSQSLAPRVASTSLRPAASTSPTHTVPQLSPKTPSTKTLTSNETTSPSRRTRESGIPWQMTSFGDAQIDLGKPM